MFPLESLDYMGVSSTRQPPVTIRQMVNQVTAWRFDVMIYASHHADLMDNHCANFSDYVRLYILKKLLTGKI